MASLNRNEAAVWIEGLLKSIPETNKVYPYFRHVKNNKQLLAAFGSGCKDDELAEKTRGWHIVFRQWREKSGSRASSGSTVIVYSGELVNYWSEYKNGSSLLDACAHIDEVCQFLLGIKRKYQRQHDFTIETLELRDTFDCIWPAPGGRIHHKSEIFIEVSRKERVF